MLTRLRRRSAATLAMASLATMLILGGALGLSIASAAQPVVSLGTAASFAVLAGTTVTNTGPSVISGSVGLSPGSAITGFPPGTVKNGTQHAADSVALQAKNDLITAYNDAAGRTPFTAESKSDLTGKTLGPGVYKGPSTLSLTGTVTLDGQGNANSVFIFQTASTLITASSSTVSLINGASWCNVFWQVGSSATLGTNSTFVGTIMALTSGTLDTGATVMGRVLARNGAVTLDDNTFTQTACTGAGAGGGGGTGSTPNGTVPNGNGLGSGVVPTGFPATGLGGASRSADPALVALGGVALLGASLALGVAFRRRRTGFAASRLSTNATDGDE